MIPFRRVLDSLLWHSLKLRKSLGRGVRSPVFSFDYADAEQNPSGSYGEDPGTRRIGSEPIGERYE